MDHIYGLTSFLFIAAGQINYPVKGLDVHLSPKFKHVQPNSQLILNCSFPMLNAEKITVNWEFNFNNTKSNSKRLMENDRFRIKNDTNWSSLTLKNIHVNDSGWYFCKVIVEIPGLREYWSNASHIIIVDSGTANVSTSMMEVLVGAGAAAAVVIALIVFWILWWRKRHRERENPVYENTKPNLQAWGPKQPSPRPCVQTDQSRILVTTPKTTRSHEKNRIYENMHPTTRNDAQKTVAPRMCIQTELKNTAYENVKAAKPARKHPNKIRTKV